MIYKLERRGTGLVMPTSLMNFLVKNGISYKYDYEQEGIDISEEAYNRIFYDFSPISTDECVNYREEPKRAIKTEIKKNKKRRLF